MHPLILSDIHPRDGGYGRIGNRRSFLLTILTVETATVSSRRRRKSLLPLVSPPIRVTVIVSTRRIGRVRFGDTRFSADDAAASTADTAFRTAAVIIVAETTPITMAVVQVAFGDARLVIPTHATAIADTVDETVAAEAETVVGRRMGD